jgi:diacylglycerol kinase family enzyme
MVPDHRPVMRALSGDGWTPADPPRRPVLFVNERSGGGKASRAAVADHARRRGIQAVILGADRTLAAMIDEALASGTDALGVAGGDGSLADVAAAACAHGIPLVCVPAGTRNHFARDLGVDVNDLVGALEAFTEGVERRVDVARVNGRVFLNNVSLGFYGDAVRHPAYRDAKMRTLLQTVVAGMSPRAESTFRLVDDLGCEHAQPVLLLVSNNPYSLDPPLIPGTRATLDSGRLGILVLDSRGGSPHQPARAWTAPRLEVSAPGSLHAGVDGEAVELSPPVNFALLPATLRVRISSRHPGVPPSILTPHRRLPWPVPSRSRGSGPVSTGRERA